MDRGVSAPLPEGARGKSQVWSTVIRGVSAPCNLVWLSDKVVWTPPIFGPQDQFADSATCFSALRLNRLRGHLSTVSRPTQRHPPWRVG